MELRLFRLRWRRRFRKGHKQVESINTQTSENLDKHLVKKFGNLMPVRRFVFGWLALMLILIGGLIAQNLALSNYYQTLRTVPGGIYNEGVLGTFTTANPIYATSDADLTVSRLVFASLFQYDATGKLAPELASSYSVNAHGNEYVVHLKPNLTWQDGKPLTSSDVVFTYHKIQDPDAKSPLQNDWQGINVSAPDPLTVVFHLPDALASFPYNLTNGIVPEHLLASVSAPDLRSSDFNTLHPVGSGPFSWQAIQVSGNGDPLKSQARVALVPFTNYALGKPKLQKFVVEVFADSNQLSQAFADGSLTAAEGITTPVAKLISKASVAQHNLIYRAANMVFFKTSSGILSDKAVRSDLVQAANVPKIISSLSYSTRAVREPLLEGQLAYDPAFVQPGFDLNAARNSLTADGWIPGKGFIRYKGNQQLGFALTAANNPESHKVASQLQQQWKALGVNVFVRYLDPADYQTALSYHDYDAILNGISIGVDPDVYVYWDSSQADIRSPNRLNFSEWKNAQADVSLESGRTRLNPTLRALKYKPFLQAWQQDAPALGLYQPRLLYLTNGYVNGLIDHPLVTATDRLAGVQNWEIKQNKVTNQT